MEDIRPPRKNDQSKVEKLQQKLYSPNEQFTVVDRKKLTQKEHSTGSDWDNGSLKEELQNFKPKKRFNYFFIIFTLAALFFAGAIGYAALTFLGGDQVISGNDVDISVVGPVSIGGGEELELDVLVQNSNQTQLETVDLVIEYPEGTKKVDDLKTDLPRVREGLGIIQPDSVVKRTYSSALFGEEGTEKEIKVRVEYRLPGSNAIFEKEKTFNLVLQSSPIRVQIDSVKEITPNQELVFNVELSSNSNQTLENVMLVVDYPFGFTLTDAGFETYDRDNVWLFEKLRPQEKLNFEIKGKLEGQDNEERYFKFEAGLQDSENLNELGVKFIELPKVVTISRPFLDLRLAIDGDESDTLVKEAERQMTGRLTFVNNTNGIIRDAQIVMTVTGPSVDESSFSVGEGFYKSSDNTLTWDEGSADELVEILPGEDGVLSFSFKTKPIGSPTSVFKNPEILMDVVATGRRFTEENVPEEIRSTTFKRLLIASDTSLLAVASYSSGPFQNTGPIPPKVDQDTTYTIRWDLANSSNQLENGKVTATIPNYVKWNNRFSGDGSMEFDPVTRIATWNIGTVEPHSGFTVPEKSIYFQVTLTPSISQVGDSPNLTGRLNFTGFDSFVERNVTASQDPATTNLEFSNNLFDSKVTE